MAPEEDAILALVSNYKKQIADIIRGYAVQISDSSATISNSENTIPHKKDFRETVLKKTSIKPENPNKIKEDINIKSVIEHIKNIFTMILLFDDADVSNDGVQLEQVIDSSSYIDEKIDEIKKCKKNDKLIYCYLAGIQDSLKIGDRLQKKTQILKQKSQIIRKIDNAVGEITRRRQNKEVVIFDDADDEDEEDSTDDGFWYSVKWDDGTKYVSIQSRQLMKEIKPILGIIVGITSVCRDLKDCLIKDEKIRHKIGNDIREGIYDGNNKIQFRDVKTTLNQFTVTHYNDVLPDRKSNNNSRDTCEIFRNGEWISMFNLHGKSDVNIYNVKWDNNEKPEQYDTLKALEKDAIQLSNAVAFDISQLEKREIRDKIDRQFKIIRYLMTEVPDGKLVINNLYQYIKGNMDKNKQRLIGDSFNYVETGFCPTDFINNENVLEIIRKHLTPDKSAKHLFGEVFTPLKLVCEMLSHLPSNVWTNRDLKWFDPANGIGNFPIVVYYKLMQMLTGFKSEKAKSKHIIENMLYMNELNQINVGICKRIFKLIDASAEPNIYKSDFLVSTKTDLSRLRFDVIIGNPPYNPPKTETGSSGNSIWQHFVIKSFYMLKEKGYLVFVHPPGWKKPTEEIFDPVKLDILGGQYYKSEKSVKQIRQGLVWQFLKENGIFSFIYTNDQRIKKTDEYIDHFPAIDYYVYKKGGAKDVLCDTKNVFFDVVKNGDDVKLKYDLKYLPNLITKQAMIILDKITSKAGDKPQFVRYRNGSGFSVDPSKGKYKYIYTYDKNSTPKYQYSNIASDNINLDKVIMNFDGGIDYYTIQYVKKEDLIGSYEMTMYSEVDTDKRGRCIVKFFKSDIVRFIFLITQYSSGKRTKNEPLVANSITIPPEDITDYYKFFGIESYQKYIEDILAHYESTKKKEKKGGFTKRNVRSNRNSHTRRNNSK